MNKTVKKGLIIAGIAMDMAITVFLFVISIIMIVRSSQVKDIWDVKEATGFIGYLQNNPNVYLAGFVVPLFVLLAVNIVALVMYVRKSNKKEVSVSDLSKEQKEALKKQLMEELSKK